MLLLLSSNKWKEDQFLSLLIVTIINERTIKRTYYKTCVYVVFTSILLCNQTFIYAIL